MVPNGCVAITRNMIFCVVGCIFMNWKCRLLFPPKFLWYWRVKSKLLLKYSTYLKHVRHVLYHVIFVFLWIDKVVCFSRQNFSGLEELNQSYYWNIRHISYKHVRNVLHHVIICIFMNWKCRLLFSTTFLRPWRVNPKLLLKYPSYLKHVRNVLHHVIIESILYQTII